jgi:hypothetical protein
MNTVTIYLCEDTGPDYLHGYGETPEEAGQFVAWNRAYNNIEECIADGWAKPIVPIEVPLPVAHSLLAMCEIYRRL